MSEATPIGLRIPEDLIQRVDGFADRLSKQAGIPVSRSAAIRRLLELALEREEKGKRSA